MEVEVCMNCLCKSGDTHEWKKGWPLSSGGFARLCDNCGSAYANSIFCEKFHQHQTGWMKCTRCYKPVHCGCIVSRPLFEYLDFGGIGCVTCLNASQRPLIWGTESSNGSVRSVQNNANDHRSNHLDGKLMVDGAGKGKAVQVGRNVEASEAKRWPQAQIDGIDSSIVPNMKGNRRFPNVMKPASRSLPFPTLESNRPTWQTRSMNKAHLLNMSLGTLSGNSVLPSASASLEEGRLEGKALSCPFHQAQRPLSMLSKRSTSGITIDLEPDKGAIFQERVSRQPADGRAKNLLLSRYWPKMTDQELEQLSGGLKSSVVPLFEKVLSASDAGRIGRLVLPKSCAEAYFPPISQPEGRPLQILDMKGNEWTFQFRFWPNNNSRMYVLEGVTPCMQSFQLSAGDIVTFSRIGRGGKFVLGYRRVSDSTDTQDDSISASASPDSNDLSTKETIPSGATANQDSRSSVPDLPHTMKENGEPKLNGSSEHSHLAAGTADCFQVENSDMANNDLLQQPTSASETATQNIGPKTLLIHDEDAMEMTLTWEEAQDLLQPPPNVEPSIEIIEDQEFEEYAEPPVFGRRTTISANDSGLLNAALKALEKIMVTSRGKPDTYALNALASAALSDDGVDPANSSLGPTSKHPRHRAGCTCIVCIQPSSGNGKHKLSCACPACMTAKRRCNTIMMRKRKRRPDGTQRGQVHDNAEDTTNGASGDVASLNRGGLEVDEPGAGQLDLNCDPNGENMPLDV